MKTTVIITSMSELCRYLNMKDIEIIGMEGIKGIDKEDIVKLTFINKDEEF